MNNKRPTVTYIIDGKEETKTINMFNKKNLEEKLFSLLYINPLTQSKGIELNPEVEYIKLENIDFDKDVKFETKSDKSVVILENCNFLRNLILENGTFEIINPTFKSYNPKIESWYSEEINVVFSEDKKQKLSIDLIIKSENFSLTNAKKVGDFRIESNNVTITNSVLKDFEHLNVFEISNSNNTIIKESNISNRFRITLEAKKLTLINSSIEGFYETEVELSVGTIVGNNFLLSSDYFISIKNIYNFSIYLYKALKNKKVKLTDKELFQESKLTLIMDLTSALKTVRNNAQKQIQDLQEEKNNEYEEKINYHNNEINNHKEKIKELEEKSVIDSKKLARKLKHQSIKNYYK